MSYLIKVSHVATMMDCWTVHQHSLLDVTAHWMDEATLGGKSSAVMCQRVTGSPSSHGPVLMTFAVMQNKRGKNHRRRRVIANKSIL